MMHTATARKLIRQVPTRASQPRKRSAEAQRNLNTIKARYVALAALGVAHPEEYEKLLDVARSEIESGRR